MTDLERAIAFAEQLAGVFVRHGISARAWGKPGIGARVYVGRHGFLVVSRGGDVSDRHRGQATFLETSLYPRDRRAYRAAREEYRHLQGSGLRGNPPGPLQRALDLRRPRFAAAAQRVLDGWEQDEEGVCDVLGTGGPCDMVADELQGELDFEYTDAGGVTQSPGSMPGGHDGDDHAWLIVYDDHEAVVLDLPPDVYETGGGYQWKKRRGVQIRPSDFVIESISRSDIEPEDDSW